MTTAASDVHDVRVHLFVHSRSARITEVCAELDEDPRVTLYSHCENRGLALSWNDGMLNAFEAGADVVVIANDDLFFAIGDIDKIAATAEANRDRYVISCAGYHMRLGRRMGTLGYSCYGINPIAVATIGCFDENFFPAFFEDVDYHRRATLAGLHEWNCPDTAVCHFGSGGGAAPTTRGEVLAKAGNAVYYRRKWGGGPGRERFARPFGALSFDLMIPPERRHAPYGQGYDRADLPSVAM